MRLPIARRSAAALAAAALFGCAPSAEPRGAPVPAAIARPASPAAASVPADGGARPGAPAGATDELVLVTDRAALAAAEASGLALADVVGPDGVEAIAGAIEREVLAVSRTDRQSGVGIGAKPHRLFDVRFLRSPEARFELAGITARLDRLPLEPRGCGEVRLVFRLAYRSAAAAAGRAPVAIASRLPATLNVAFWAAPPSDAPDCGAAARGWLAPAGLAGAALGRWLVSGGGPLRSLVEEGEGAAHEGARLRGRLKSIGINVQTVRWPSTVRPDMAGHAEYALLSLVPDAAGALAPGALEATPDVERLRADRAARADLLRWIRDPASLAAIDAGSAVVPERFLARRAVSVSPRGLARRSNRPFRQLFGPTDVAGVDLGRSRHVRSPAALLRRLDELTCPGCHQSRSVAGFHLLGEDAATGQADALAVPVSPHLAADLARRRRQLRALAEGTAREDASSLAERADGEPGGWGVPCGLGDPGFAAWICAPGLHCIAADTSTDDGEVGMCLADAPGRPGDPCELARIGPDARGRADRVAEVIKRPCGDGAVCERSSVGFPAGMCSSGCGPAGADVVCGGIPVLTAFNDCLARRTPFDACLAEHTRPAGLRACDIARPCRDDYVCARTPGGGGACMPPYFLFQLRVDGHPVPAAGAGG